MIAVVVFLAEHRIDESDDEQYTRQQQGNYIHTIGHIANDRTIRHHRAAPETQHNDVEHLLRDAIAPVLDEERDDGSHQSYDESGYILRTEVELHTRLSLCTGLVGVLQSALHIGNDGFGRVGSSRDSVDLRSFGFF